MRDEYGRSARQRAFMLFSQGYRPSQLPDFGVKRVTLYRYWESWKHRGDDLSFRLLNRILRTNPDQREELARKMGISENQLMEALKHSRNAAQLKRRLGVEQAQQLERLVQDTRELELAKVIGDLSRCRSTGERTTKFREAAKRMGMSEAELILALEERKKRLGAREKSVKEW